MAFFDDDLNCLNENLHVNGWGHIGFLGEEDVRGTDAWKEGIAIISKK